MLSHNSLMQALGLTRAGDPRGATRLIRAALHGSVAPVAPAFTPPPASAPPPAGAVIDLKPERVTIDPGAVPPTGRARRGNGRFTLHRHQSRQGSLAYRLYRPATLEPGAPLLVMLHGCTQDAADFARGTAMNCHAEERGMLVLWPEQSKGANPSRCWNWFDPAHQAADGGEPARIADLVRRLVREHGLDESRVFAAGLSAGGAAAAVLGATHPELFAGIGIHSGLACGAATDLPSALMAMKRGAAGRRPLAFVPTIIFHGDRDQTVHHVNGEQIMALARQASRAPLETRVETGAEPGGHAWTRTVARDATGRIRLEQWVVHGAAHAWSGGDPAGRYTDPAGPDASAAMLHFFLDRG